MLTVEKLPTHIKEVAENHQKRDIRYHVFPSMFLIEDEKYYLFMYEPTKEQLIIREDGKVLTKEHIKKPFLYALAYNSSIENISNIGGEWVEARTIQRYKKLNSILNSIENIIKGNAPAHISKSLIKLKDASRIIIQEQENINRCVEDGLALTINTNDSELVTMDEYFRMRKYVLGMVRAAYKQNEIQLETEEERSEIFKYLSQNKLSFGLRLLPLYFQFAPYKKLMRTSDSYGSDKMENIKKLIAKDVDIEKDIEALNLLKLTRNPD
ncbi:hypothetical protein [Fictibacillus sp. 18YEL24]|uniref:hypothetical protein n=1 Tax=Fictibacillus sp. 18YEL24 TaxID=2745875 RepID=UPI0018CF6FF2|nr:hypothetical protein [Fictibacillus sp. 18YEL24]MBH0171681.1 hypothetical protein [Fictibacillus sp. 18YEL24]